MDITPMSMQMVIPRTSETTQVQHNLNQQAAVQQDYQAVQDKMEMRQKETSVHSRENPEDGRIKDDPDHRNGGEYHGSRRRRQSQPDEMPEEDFQSVDASRGHHIDISF